MIFFKYALLFFIGSIGGWILEFFFRRFFSPPRKWVNPGFLNGPYLPLYGTGICILYMLCSVDLSFINAVWLQLIIRLAVICVVLTLIEYITGLIFIKALKVKLWDYTRRWGNIQGIICPLFSLFWTIGGAIFYYFMYTPLCELTNWLDYHIYFIFVLGLFYGVVLVDIGISFNVASKVYCMAQELSVAVNWEYIKMNVSMQLMDMKEKTNFLFPFSKIDKTDLRKSIEAYKESIEKKIKHKIDKNNRNGIEQK